MDQGPEHLPVGWLVSHCRPDPRGTAAQARAWQLLRALGHTHRVVVISAADAPFHYWHWQILRHASHGVALSVPGVWEQVRKWCGKSTASDGWGKLDEPWFKKTGEGMLKMGHRPQIVVLTHPKLVSCLPGLGGAEIVCDLTLETAVKCLGEKKKQVLSWLAGCETVVSEEEGVNRILPWMGDRQIVLHRGLESRFFPVTAVPDQEKKNTAAQGHGVLLFAAADSQANQIWGQFQQQVWPQWQKRLPKVGLKTLTGHVVGWVDTLDQASLVVVPEIVPERANWLVMAAMAMGKVVMTSMNVAYHLGLQHQEHLLAAQSGSDWSRLAQRILENPAELQRLGRQAGQIARQRFDLGVCSDQWDAWLTQRTPTLTTQTASEKAHLAA